MKVSVQDLYDKNACPEAVAFYDRAKLYNIDWAEVVTVEISENPDWVEWLVMRYNTAIEEIVGFATYERDAYGNITSTTCPDGRTYTYTYDRYGNMTSTTCPDGEMYIYTYDWYGNMTSMTCPDGRMYTYTPDMDVAGMWIKLTMDSGKIVTREVTE